MSSKVLLIEPDVVLARTYVEALRSGGFEITSVMSAQAALDAADASLPDIVVLELQLPLHSGIEFLYEFRSYAEWQDLPVIINSYVHPQELAKVQIALYQNLGVRACLYKPHTTLRALLSAISEHVNSGAT